MMQRMMFGLAAVIAATSGTAAYAQVGYVTATYSGTVTRIYDGSAFALNVPVSYSVTFDPATLVDRTASVNAVLASLHDATPLHYASVLVSSLSDDPNASLFITIGNVTFDKFSEYNYGTTHGDTNIDLGAGNFPIVEYLNGAFAGIGGTFYDEAMSDIEFYTDPIGAARGAFGRNHNFYVDSYDSHDDYLDGNSSSDAAGFYDITRAVFTASAVPEPATWAMMLGGFCLIAGVIRRRQHGTAIIA